MKPTPFNPWHRWSALLSGLILVASVLLVQLPVAAAPPVNSWAPPTAKAVERVAALGIVKGTPRPDGTVDMALFAPITRAQLVTVIVRAMGGANEAQSRKGEAAFPDTARHWASGEIAVAQSLVGARGGAIGLTAANGQTILIPRAR